MQVLALVSVSFLIAVVAAIEAQVQDAVYVCPMDPEIRSNRTGKCSRCGMALTAHVQEPVEYQMDMQVAKRLVRAGQPVDLTFQVTDPWKHRAVTAYQLMHEKLFHLFVVSEDLQHFRHEHPVKQKNGTFQHRMSFPQAGTYRLLGDFYPDGGTPQLIANTLVVAGQPPAPNKIETDYSSKQAENIKVHLTVSPSVPVAGKRVRLAFRVEPDGGLEPYLGSWAHMMAASEDLIDLMHEHPTAADGGSHLLFNLEFPRAVGYRVWIQLQRSGVVNTVHFDVKVAAPDED